jgi:hypothetical protein
LVFFDATTYLIALFTLIFVPIPQLEKAEGEEMEFSLMKDIVFGWRYLADRRGLLGILFYIVFIPLLLEGGALADTFVGDWLGVGPGRGIGLMMICSGLLMLVISVIAYANPHIRNVETEIPDAVPEEPEDAIAVEKKERQPSPVQG